MSIIKPGCKILKLVALRHQLHLLFGLPFHPSDQNLGGTQRTEAHKLVHVLNAWLSHWAEWRIYAIIGLKDGTNCRIWSWSPMPCKKYRPRDSVDKNRGRRPRFLSLLRPEGHAFHTAWETMIKSYYSTLADFFFFAFYSHKYEF